MIMSFLEKRSRHVFNVHGMNKQDFIPKFNEKMRSFIRET
jgi:hypothetical protein